MSLAREKKLSMSQLNLIDSNLHEHTDNNDRQSHLGNRDSVTMTNLNLETKALNLEQINRDLENENADGSTVVEWARKTFADKLVMSTSFGIQSAVMLHMVTRIVANIPIIFIDTGYLFPETYQFAEQLTKRLNLNLHIYQSPISPARMEAIYGKLWEQDNVEALNLYDRIRKVEPMQRALQELNAKAWLAGLRSDQTAHRQTLDRITKQGEQYKIHPILNWHSRDIYNYLQAYNLPYHPLFDRGYVTVGDWHTTRPLTADDDNERSTRFNGLKQECGLHLPQTPEEAISLDSSSL